MSNAKTDATLVDPKSLNLSDLIDLIADKIYGNENADLNTDGKLDMLKLIDADIPDDSDDIHRQIGILSSAVMYLADAWHYRKYGSRMKKAEIRYKSDDGDEAGSSGPAIITIGPDNPVPEQVNARFISADHDETKAAEITSSATREEKKKKPRKKDATAACSIDVSVKRVRRKKKHGSGRWYR